MSTVEATSTIETRAMPNTVVFGFVKALAAELSQGQVELPSVPDIVLKLQKTLSDDNVSNETVVRVLGAEPMLAGKLMNMANSAALNSSGRRIADLRTAVARVGFNIVRSASLAFVVDQLRKIRRLQTSRRPVGRAVEEQRADRRAVARDRAALLFAQRRHGLVSRAHVQRGAHLHPHARRQISEPRCRSAHLQLDRARLAHERVEALLENWKVADEIVDAVAGHEDMDREQRGPVTLTDVLALATLVERNRHGGELDVADDSLIKGLKRMQLQLRDCAA